MFLYLPRIKPQSILLALLMATTVARAQELPTDYLSLAQGAIPIAIQGEAEALRISMEAALLSVDGDPNGFSLTPKPGGTETAIAFVYALPANTIFESFAVPNVLETPSPSQTFFRTVEVAGSDQGPEGPFQVLASATLSTHDSPGQVTTLAATTALPVRWVRVALSGGIDVQREQTFFEFSEIIGHGRQDPVPLVEHFSGQWKGRGVLLALQQTGAQVSGCYDREGELSGTVSGNILRATGQTPAGIPSSFVLAVGHTGEITGVRSTNGAPFKLYTGEVAPDANTACSPPAAQPPGCGATLHGINFDLDSATLRPDAVPLLDALAVGLEAEVAAQITVIGHTSSEGSDAYNYELSQRRASAVVEAMVTRGIAPTRLAAEGRGETQPMADNASEAGRALNRRVEIACR